MTEAWGLLSRYFRMQFRLKFQSWPGVFVSGDRTRRVLRVSTNLNRLSKVDLLRIQSLGYLGRAPAQSTCHDCFPMGPFVLVVPFAFMILD